MFQTKCDSKLFRFSRSTREKIPRFGFGVSLSDKFQFEKNTRDNAFSFVLHQSFRATSMLNWCYKYLRTNLRDFIEICVISGNIFRNYLRRITDVILG